MKLTIFSVSMADYGMYKVSLKIQQHDCDKLPSIFFSIEIETVLEINFPISIFPLSNQCVAKNPRGETDGTIRLYGECI